MASETISSASLCRWENAEREVRSDEGHGGVVTWGVGPIEWGGPGGFYSCNEPPQPNKIFHPSTSRLLFQNTYIHPIRRHLNKSNHSARWKCSMLVCERRFHLESQMSASLPKTEQNPFFNHKSYLKETKLWKKLWRQSNSQRGEAG